MRKSFLGLVGDKRKIRSFFSGVATHYDEYAYIQKLLANKLVNEIPSSAGVNNILEIGCGTGNYTLFLSKKFPQAKITALDISVEMLNIAKSKIKENKRIKFILADGENLPFKERFSLITSNATFQWFMEGENTFRQCRKLLEDNGILWFSTFGPSTFREIKYSLNILGKYFSLPVENFLSFQEIKLILERNFSKVEIEEERMEELFFSIRDLLLTLRYTGGVNRNKGGLLTPYFLDRWEELFYKEWGKIFLTYQVFLCYAV